LRSLRRRIGAAATTAALIGGVGISTVAGIVASAGAAGAVVANLTHNDNACTTSAQPNSPSLIAVGLGADQSDPGLTNSVDATTGATIVTASNTTVANGAGLTPTHSILQGSSAGSLTNVTGELFVSAAFVQAGVGLGIVTVGQSITADVQATIDATNATFNATQPSGVTVVSPTQAILSGTNNASGTVVGTGTTVTAPIDAVGPLPSPNFSVPNTSGLNAFFYQDSTPPVAPNIYPGDGTGSTSDSSAHIVAHVGTLNVPLGCLPGESPNPQTVPASWTQTSQSNVLIFADLAIAPALPPTLVPQTVPSVNLGGQVVIHALAGATDNVPINPASVTVTAAPAHGSTTVNTATGDVTYTNDGTGAGGPDSFQVTASSSGGTSAAVTETISTIVANPSSCVGGTNSNAGSLLLPPNPCSLNQIVIVPVLGASITMDQGTGLPQDILGGVLDATTGTCNPGPITLNGEPQTACGALAPVTVTNATGVDNAWFVTGQVSDFVDPGVFTLPSATQVGSNICDTAPSGGTFGATGYSYGTPGNYSNHCIPGGNLSWFPVAAVAHTIVAGDTANINPGPPVLGGLAAQAPTALNAAGLQSLGTGVNPALAAFGEKTQTNPVTELPSAAGLHTGAQPLCATQSGQSGGTFVCGAGLVVSVPASAAATVAPGFEATLVLTLVLM
jgi:hypothetical protein